MPFSLIARLWRATAGISELQAAQVCKRLVQLALVSEAVGLGGGITLHDVVRDYLRAGLGQRLIELNGLLMKVVASDLPSASSLGCPDLAQEQVAWWALGAKTEICGITSSSNCWTLVSSTKLCCGR